MKEPLLNLWSVTILVLSSIAAAAQSADTADAALRQSVDRIATSVLDQTGVPSASIAVIKHGKLAYLHAYGRAQLEPARAATTEMRYSIGSISKQFTASAILLLQEQGKLSLNDPVGKYIPGLTQGEQVTIRQVLSHTSGYQDYSPEDYIMTPLLKPETAQQILDAWAKKPLDFEPGTKWQYSNTNYVIAGLIVEKVSGQKLTEFQAEHIFRPLNMRSVWNSDEERLPPTDATPYYRRALGPLRLAPYNGRGWMFAAGDLAMTAHDLALWDESLIARSLLKPESYNEMFTEVKLKDGRGTNYGLGQHIYDDDGHQRIAHGGEVSGFVSDNEVRPGEGAAVVVLTNQDAVDAASTIARLALDVVLGPDVATPEVRQALAIYRDLQHGHIDRRLLAPNLNDYFTQEALDDFRTSLGPLGEPLGLHQTNESQRGGMTFRVFEIAYPHRWLTLTTYTYPDGKLEQYLVAPED